MPKNNAINNTALSLTTDSFIVAGTTVTANSGLVVNSGGAQITGATNINGGTVNIATVVGADPVNISTAASARTTTIGNTTGASALLLRTGTGDFSLSSASGTIISALDSGEITCPLQPAFFAYQASSATNATGDGTAYTLGSTVDLTEVYDQNGDFNPATGTFTAPVTGIYNFSVVVDISNLGAHTLVISTMVASSATLFGPLFNPANVGSSNTVIYDHTSYIQMTAGDTVTFVVTVSGSTKTVTVTGQALGSGALSYVSGALIC